MLGRERALSEEAGVVNSGRAFGMSVVPNFSVDEVTVVERDADVDNVLLFAGRVGVVAMLLGWLLLPALLDVAVLPPDIRLLPPRFPPPLLPTPLELPLIFAAI